MNSLTWLNLKLRILLNSGKYQRLLMPLWIVGGDVVTPAWVSWVSRRTICVNLHKLLDDSFKQKIMCISLWVYIYIEDIPKMQKVLRLSVNIVWNFETLFQPFHETSESFLID